MQLLPPLIQATPELTEPTVRGLAAIQAVDGFTVALLGMSVVFCALLLLFFLMIGLQRLLEPRPVPAVEAKPAAAIPRQGEHAEERDGLAPQLVVAIATAIRLEQHRQASVARAAQPGGAPTGWVLARAAQWSAHQAIFLRQRR
jgi:sodium pump decarboxylase gamma subunit